MTVTLVSLEEHYYSKSIYDSFENAMKSVIQNWPEALEKLLSVSGRRLTDMDKGKITFQVISHCVTEDPSSEACCTGNDQLASDIKDAGVVNSKRYAAFAVLPMGHPNAAARELERAIKELGFVGALVDHKIRDKYCDSAEYDVLWAKLQELDVPIYLHPSWPSEDMLARYSGNYSSKFASVVGSAMWGWHNEVGVHILRLHAARVFDKFPKLKIIIGHFGEMIPFMLQRINDQEMLLGQERPKRSFRQVWDENIWITTSGVWSLDPLRCILSNTKVDRILYSVDYPFTTNEHGLKWIEELEKSGLVTAEQLEMIAYRNACSLLRLSIP